MTADLRDLDRRVAEEVMGVCLHPEPTLGCSHEGRCPNKGRDEFVHDCDCKTKECEPGCTTRPCVEPYDSMDPNGGGCWTIWVCAACDARDVDSKTQPRMYSREPTACAEVKRRLRDAGIEFAVVDMAGFLVVWVADIQKGTILTHHDKDDPMAEADTEEEAVARFALACAEAGLLEAST